MSRRALGLYNIFFSADYQPENEIKISKKNRKDAQKR